MKESSDSAPRRVAGEAEGEGGGWVQKKLRPAVNCALSAPCKGACFSELQERLPCSCRRCMCKSPSLVSEDARCHIPALLRGEQSGMFNARALGQSAQAEQDTLILYSSQESVRSGILRFFKWLLHGLK